MSVKLIILFVLSLIMGVAFTTAGFYFLSQKYLDSLNEATSEKSEEALKKNMFKAKGTGYVAIAFGAVTLVWAAAMFMFPQILSALALIYMIFLAIAFLFLYFVFR